MFFQLRKLKKLEKFMSSMEIQTNFLWIHYYTYIIFAHVFIYHYVHTPKLGSFKQHTFMNSEFLRVKNQE